MTTNQTVTKQRCNNYNKALWELTLGFQVSIFVGQPSAIMRESLSLLCLWKTAGSTSRAAHRSPAGDALWLIPEWLPGSWENSKGPNSPLILDSEFRRHFNLTLLEWCYTLYIIHMYAYDISLESSLFISRPESLKSIHLAVVQINIRNVEYLLDRDLDLGKQSAQ